MHFWVHLLFWALLKVLFFATYFFEDFLKSFFFTFSDSKPLWIRELDWNLCWSCLWNLCWSRFYLFSQDLDHFFACWGLIKACLARSTMTTWSKPHESQKCDLIKRYLEVTLDRVENTGDLFHGPCTLSQWWLLLSQRLADLAQSMEASWNNRVLILFLNPGIVFWAQQMVELNAFDLWSWNCQDNQTIQPTFIRLSQHLVLGLSFLDWHYSICKNKSNRWAAIWLNQRPLHRLSSLAVPPPPVLLLYTSVSRFDWSCSPGLEPPVLLLLYTLPNLILHPCLFKA